MGFQWVGWNQHNDSRIEQIVMILVIQAVTATIDDSDWFRAPSARSFGLVIIWSISAVTTHWFQWQFPAIPVIIPDAYLWLCRLSGRCFQRTFIHFIEKLEGGLSALLRVRLVDRDYSARNSPFVITIISGNVQGSNLPATIHFMATVPLYISEYSRLYSIADYDYCYSQVGQRTGFPNRPNLGNIIIGKIS